MWAKAGIRQDKNDRPAAAALEHNFPPGEQVFADGMAPADTGQSDDRLFSGKDQALSAPDPVFPGMYVFFPLVCGQQG